MWNKALKLLVLLFVLSSCARQWSDSSQKPIKLPKLKQKEFVSKLDSISKNAPHYLYTKLKVNYKDQERKVSFKTTLKAVNDSAVSALVSFARIPVFSALIDASKLMIVNKKEKCFSEESLNSLSKKLGVSFQRDNIEEIIYGHAIGFSKSQKYHMFNDPFHYVLSTHRKGYGRKKKEIVYTYQLHPTQNHLEQTKIHVPMDSTEIEVNYLEWQYSESFLLPKKIQLKIQTPIVSATIELQYTKLDVVTPDALFLIIPEKYEKCD